MKIALALARSRFGGWALRLAFGKFHRLLPLKRLQEGPGLLAFWHPAPAYLFHILLVPKKGLRSIAHLERWELESMAIEAFQMGRQIAHKHGLGPFRLVLNAGKFQESGQLHFHLIPPGENKP
jgi:diadenosine tetraphosphate (Ap4A) HIT family hydrolase